MIKRLCLIFAVLFVSSGFTGCQRAGESIKNDRRFMVSALGFETDGALIKVTSELIIINSEDPETPPEAKTLTAESATIVGALQDISAGLSKPMLLEHCGVLAIGDRMTEKCFSEICDYCFSENRITLSAYMVSTPDPALLLSGKPESSVAVGYDIMSIIEQQNSSNQTDTDSRFFEVESIRESGKNIFVLPRFEKDGEALFFDGVAVFEKDRLTRRISREMLNADNFRLPTGSES